MYQQIVLYNIKDDTLEILSNSRYLITEYGEVDLFSGVSLESSCWLYGRVEICEL